MTNNSKLSGSLLFRFVKRSFDIVCSLLLMIPLLLIIGASAVFIKAEDGGPVFYMAERLGCFGKPFKMYKLRSMKVNAPDIRLSDGSTYNGEDDPRVTKFGRFARKTSIDELPQIINILKGDMSFIGPRPDTLIGLDDYSDDEMKILTVRPGITGYNQAVNRNAVLTKEKHKNDIYYVEHLSIGFDIKIIFMTLATVLGRKNINREDINIEDTYILENRKSETTEIK